MCGLCSQQESQRKDARDEALRISHDLKQASDLYYAMAHGRLKPHTDEIKPLSMLAKTIVRELVNEWF